MKTFQKKFIAYVRKNYAGWGELENTPLLAGYTEIYDRFPFLTCEQVLNLFSYCGGMEGVNKALTNRRFTYYGKGLTRIPAISHITARKIMNY